MQSFKDTQGTNWDLQITVLIARTIKARTGIDIHQLFNEETLKSLANEIEKTIDMLWVIVERQAVERDVTYETFFTDLCDSEVYETAIDRVLDAIVDYYPEKKRPYARKMLMMLRKTGEQAIELAIKQLEKMETLTPGNTSKNSPG